MPYQPHPWSLKGVTPAARAAVRDAAHAEGKTIGEWLSNLIRETAAAQGVTEPPPQRPAPRPVVVARPAPRPVERASSIERAMGGSATHEPDRNV